MENKFELLLKSRNLVLKLIEDLSIEQLNNIPKGFSNNIVWNIGHLVVTQQLLCYKLSNLPMLVSDDVVEKYKKGSFPKGAISSTEFQEIKKMFLELPKQFQTDHKKGIFTSYEPYTTSVDVTLSSIDSALAFNNYHEGIHLGVILGLRKLI